MDKNGDPMSTDSSQTLGEKTTESVDPAYSHLDSMSPAEIAIAMNDAEATVSEAIRVAIPAITQAIEAIVAAMEAGGRLIYIGSGTSGRLGVLDASECPPTFSSDPADVIGIIAGGDFALRNAIEGAEDDADAGAHDLLAHSITPNDVVVGITASGRTPYVLGAVSAAKTVGATTVGVSNNENSALGAAVDIPIEVNVGPEVLAGSTRLKAGSAQKRILNMLTTATMVKLGKTYGNLMVDVSPTNEKLRGRAVGLVTRITGTDEMTARETLIQAQWRVKVAATMLSHRVEAIEAESILSESNGRLRAALSPQTARDLWTKGSADGKLDGLGV